MRDGAGCLAAALAKGGGAKHANAHNALAGGGAKSLGERPYRAR
jgi:hypothetical protein